MEAIKKIKEYIIKTAPSYENIETKNTLTSKIIHYKHTIGFTRIFYPGVHLEGEVKIWERRFRNRMFKHWRYLGPRGEGLYIILAAYLIRRFVQKNLEREEVDKLLVDRDTYFIAKKLNM